MSQDFTKDLIYTVLEEHFVEQRAKGLTGEEILSKLDDQKIERVYSVVIEQITKDCISDLHESLFEDARNTILPKPTVKTQSDGTVICGNWDDPQVFFQFLLIYLNENIGYLKLDGTPCSASTVAAIHTLKSKTGGEKLLIMPCKPIIEAFQRFLSERGIHKQWNDAEFYRIVKTWDIAGFVQGGRKGKDPWRHNFYQENDLPDGVTGANVNCLGFSLDGLPDEIKGLLNSCQTAQSTDKQEGGNESD